jgi:type IV pilus assembly protein PilW
MLSRDSFDKRQTGFSLVEIMVALVIGMIVTIVITQVMSFYGSQKRTTSGTSDAQTSGTLALYSIQREVQQAGYGLPLFDTVNPPLKCNLADIAMATIVAGAVNDTVTVRYGNSAVAGTPMPMLAGSTGSSPVVNSSIGCANWEQQIDGKKMDDVLVTNGANCNLTKITAPPTVAPSSNITLATGSVNVVQGASLSCLGTWRTIQFSVVGNQLIRTESSPGVAPVAAPIGSEIVAMKAQYGISATANGSATDNVVVLWSSAPPADRNQIKAIRVAVVARSGLLEKNVVTNAAPVAWDAPGAPVINLAADPNWQRYRYRVFETIIPLRNMVWSKETLK